MSHRALLPFCLVLWGAVVATAGDLTIRQRVKGAGQGDVTYEETQYLTPTKRVTDSEDRVMIIDLDARAMTLALKETKSFQKISFEQIRKETEALRERLAQLPPEAKKMMPDLDGDVTVEPTGKTEKIIGHDAKEYEIKSVIASGLIWITEDFMPPGDIAAWQEAMGTMSGPQGPGGKLAAAMAKLKGVPLRSDFTTTAAGRQMTVTTEVLEISDGEVSADHLDLPKGYKEARLADQLNEDGSTAAPGKKRKK